jgi:glycosyltransferase involved in cell wall biosynthesis
MKIALLIYELDVRGGTQKQFLRLCQYLTQQGFDFEIITKYYDKDNTYIDFQSFEIKALYYNKNDSTRRQRWRDAYKMYSIIDKKSNIINVHDHPLPKVAVLLKILRRSKIVWQINDLPCFFLSQKAPKSKLMKTLLTLLIWIGIYDYFTVNVTKNATLVKNFFNKNAEVFHCGVDSVAEGLEKHLALRNKQKIILISTGVFYPYRNYETLLLAVKELSSNREVELQIIGSTEFDQKYAKFIRQLVLELDLQEKVNICGQLNENEFVEAYNKSDIFCFINIDQSWGLAVFEAMSIGLPVIVSESVGAVELLSNGQDSIIVDPKDVDEIVNAITKLVDDQNLYSSISGNGIQKVKSMTWDRMYCEKMIDLFIRAHRELEGHE